jgi:hypothetical protein
VFTLRIFFEFKDIVGMKKSLRLPIKGSVRACVRGFTTFEVRAVFGRLFVFSYVTCGFDLNVCPPSSLVFGGLIRIFGYPPTLAPTVFQPKNNSRCHHRRSPRRTLQLRQIKKTTILPKGMKSLSFPNLLTPQIKNGEQNSKL